MTDRAIDLSIIIPAFNEEGRLPATLQKLTTFLATQQWRWEIRIVDDGSTDGMAALVEPLTRTEPRIVLQREPHRGKGGAVRHGMLASTAAFRFLCDADMAMPVFELPRFLPPAVKADVAIGSREGTRARRIGEPWLRHVTGRIFNRAIRTIAVRGISDTQCGFKMFTAEAASDIFSRATLDGWAFDVEVLAIAQASGYRIAEIEIEWHHVPESQVKISRDAWRMLADVWKVRRRARAGAFARDGRR